MIKKIFLMLLVVIALVIAAVFAYYFINLSIKSKNTTEVTVTIETGEGVNEIAKKLKGRKLIKSELVFKVYLFTLGKYNKIQPNEYSFGQVTIKDIADIITPVPEIKSEEEIKIIEGWNSLEIGEYLQEKKLVSQEEFVKLAQITDTREILPEEKYEFLVDKPSDQGLEGYLFPDTYRVYTDVSGEEIIKKMLDNFDRKLNPELRKEIKNQNKTIFEIITLASIVEKEVRKTKERRMVAGIFWKRLAEGKRLESDATINYITGKNTTMPSLEDLAVDSLYNTYQQEGLPPGPICNPSLESIKAVIYPEETDYLFFLTKPDGTAVFSYTYEEHLKNKQKYYE